MKHLMMVALVALLAGGLVLSVLAEDVPWKAGAGDKAKGDEKAPAANAPPAVTGDLKSELTQAQYASLITPIEQKVAAAEKAMEAYNKENDKPADKQNYRTLQQLKTSAAQCYLGATMAAKRAISSLPKDKKNLESTITEQYATPNKDKAISMLLELAADAKGKNDFRTAMSLYKQVLIIEPDNETAKAALTQIAEDMKKPAPLKTTNGNSTGGSSDTNNIPTKIPASNKNSNLSKIPKKVP